MSLIDVKSRRWRCGYSVFFFQAEDGIRDLVRSRGLGDVYKRQMHSGWGRLDAYAAVASQTNAGTLTGQVTANNLPLLSLIHI